MNEEQIGKHKFKGTKNDEGRMEPYVVPTMVRAVLIVVHAATHIIKIPQMTSPQETQLWEQKHEVPQMTFPQERQLRE
jgi:hypothetical protein